MAGRHADRNGDWPYHERKDGSWAPCASNPCRLHSSDGVMASSAEQARSIAHGRGDGDACEPDIPFEDISCFSVPNDVDERHVDELEKSILKHGWRGAPILVDEQAGMCISGSHRMAALQRILDKDEMDDVLQMDVAYDVGDLVDKWTVDNTVDGWCPSFPYDSLGEVFKGTEVERWKDSLEWGYDPDDD